jgi:hypothetical protein
MTQKDFQEKVLGSLRTIELCQARFEEMHKQHSRRLTILENRNDIRRGDWKSVLLLVAGAILATMPGCIDKLGLF